MSDTAFYAIGAVVWAVIFLAWLRQPWGYGSKRRKRS